jgi:LysM repeat protein
MEETRRTSGGFKRCPACGSRVAAELAMCETCGHQFGETGAIPLAEIEKARERELKRLAGQRPPPRRVRAPEAPSGPRIPWGVISVVLLTLMLLGGGFWLVQRFSARIAVETTPEPVAATAADTPTPAFALAELAPPTPTQTPYVPATSTPVPQQKYTVVAGDTCGDIAKALGVSYSEFMSINQLNDARCSRLQIGDELIIPGGTNATAATATPAGDAAPAAAGDTYIVKQGDSCSAIAAQFKISIDDIIRLNPNLNLNQQCLIQVGDTLNVSEASASTAPLATPYLLLAPTPRAAYPPPVLLTPLDDARIDSPSAILEWLSVGILQPNEIYVVQIQPAGAITVPIFETRGTFLRIDDSLMGDQVELAFAWWVQVRQRIGDQNGIPIYRDVGPPSSARRFIWRRISLTPTAAPSQ